MPNNINTFSSSTRSMGAILESRNVQISAKVFSRSCMPKRHPPEFYIHIKFPKGTSQRFSWNYFSLKKIKGNLTATRSLKTC